MNSEYLTAGKNRAESQIDMLASNIVPSRAVLPAINSLSIRSLKSSLLYLVSRWVGEERYRCFQRLTRLLCKNAVGCQTFVCIVSLFASTSHALTIRHNAVLDEKEGLLLGILKIAVRQVEPNAVFESPDEFIPQFRAEADLLNGKMSVVWGSSTPEREEKLKAIRIPAIKGLLGHRIFIIRPENQYLFDRVQTLDDLKKLKAGQGVDWGDTEILRSAGLNVITANKYESLFYMADGGRFDYFPRAVHEPWAELANYPELNLTVEKNLLLVYPLTMNFYVAPDNQELHDIIYKGLEMAIQNGAYDEFFFKHPMVKDALEKSNVSQRRVIRIQNPNVHPETPLDRKEFWLDFF